MGQKGFDRDFKLEAIRIAAEEGARATEVERRLGVRKGMIPRWKRQLRAQGEEAFPGTGHLTASEAQVRDLQRENDRPDGQSQSRDGHRPQAGRLVLQSGSGPVDHRPWAPVFDRHNSDNDPADTRAAHRPRPAGSPLVFRMAGCPP
ncbi:MAG: transposase [Candidatus Latescibacteria bacterium]|nr:transposase [Candidatus Latescibacterota bacterium]